MNYLAIIQGGDGPDVWTEELQVSAADFMDAAKQADAQAERMSGQVVELDRNDYPAPDDVAYGVAMAVSTMENPPDGECRTVELVKALVERWNRAEMALAELRRIRTEKVACGTCGGEEATSVSRARVLLQVPFAPWENVNKPEES